jgi:hypothetical protein
MRGRPQRKFDIVANRECTKQIRKPQDAVDPNDEAQPNGEALVGPALLIEQVREE